MMSVENEEYGSSKHKHQHKQVSLVSAIAKILSPIIAANRVWKTAPPTMNQEAIVRTAALEKPASVSPVVSKLAAISTMTTSTTTTSTHSHSMTKT